MPFCVVLTKEGGEIMVTLVPESWVKEEILYWPKTETTSELEQFRRNPESLPGEDWEKSKCKIKVTGIATFSEGLKLEALYSSLEDTEDEESREVTQYEEKKRKAEPTAQVNEESLSLNNNNTSDDENEEKETNKTQIMEKQSAIRETNKPIKYKNNNAGKEADDTSYSIKRSKVIAVQSDVKINNTKKYLNNTSDDKKEDKENKTKIMEKQSVVRETNQPIKHKNNAGKEADDTLGTSYSIRRSNVITVLSDVKINNKIKDLENDTKATNISSSDLTNSYVLKKNA